MNIRKFSFWFLGICVILLGVIWLKLGLRAGSLQGQTFLRVQKHTTVAVLIPELHQEGIISNPKAFWIYATLIKRQRSVSPGTYAFQAHPKVDMVVDAFKKPLTQMVRLPEGWWIQRTAKKLEKMNVCQAKEYVELTQQPQQFQKDVSFPLPKEVSLEGYLYPDTYDLPPKLGAHETILRQLKEFEKRALPLIPKQQDIHRVLTIASILELEASSPKERAIIAGVLENRLKKGMRLQLCVTALYSMQEWKELKPGETSKPNSPFNTYRHIGLPPGPICAPCLESIKAALHPISHDFLFFVARPEGGHHFSKSFNEHLHHISKRRQHFQSAK